MKDFYTDISKLKSVLRRGWLFRDFKIDRIESDAEHTYSMLMLAFYFFCKNKLKNLDFIKIMKMILCHDLGEIEIGDITPFDNYDIKLKHSQEQNAIRTIFEKYKLSELLSIWQEYNERKTPESKFVKFIDNLDYLCQANCYKKDNAKQFKTLYEECSKKHPEIIEVFNEDL